MTEATNRYYTLVVLFNNKSSFAAGMLIFPHINHETGQWSWKKMEEKVKVQFYRISRLGYYRYGNNNPEFGNATEILNDLFSWVRSNNKVLSETSTYELDDGEDEYQTYCFDLVKNNQTGDFVLVTWNEAPTNDGRFVTVDGTQTVGNADVNFTELDEGAIPGYATYFWFIPEHNVFASIRFHHSLLIGKKSLDRYLKEFAAKFTSFVVKKEVDEGIEIIGYSNNGDDVLNLQADFKSFLYRKHGEREYIKQNVDSIKKIIRKSKLNPRTVLDRNLWQKILESLKVVPRNNPLTEELKIKYEIPFTPNDVEIDEIFAEWDENHESKWDDIGFKFEADSQVRWLSSAIAKDELVLDVIRDNDEIVEAESLLNALTGSRDIALRLLS